MANKKRLQGVDVSHWQNSKVCTEVFPQCDFVICKATEGETYKDKTLDSKMKLAKECGVDLFGLYHFYNSRKTPQENAENFLETAVKYLGNNDTLLAVDVESYHANIPSIFSNDILEWCNIVFEATGIRPLVYVSATHTAKLSKLYENNYGLWVAHYGKRDTPRTGVYGKMWAIWQYSGSPIDRNIFNGNRKQYLAYCKQV